MLLWHIWKETALVSQQSLQIYTKLFVFMSMGSTWDKNIGVAPCAPIMQFNDLLPWSSWLLLCAAGMQQELQISASHSFARVERCLSAGLRQFAAQLGGLSWMEQNFQFSVFNAQRGWITSGSTHRWVSLLKASLSQVKQQQRQTHSFFFTLWERQNPMANISAVKISMMTAAVTYWLNFSASGSK